jgi:hypothetical protein
MTSRSMPSRGTKYSFCRPVPAAVAGVFRDALDMLMCGEDMTGEEVWWEEEEEEMEEKVDRRAGEEEIEPEMGEEGDDVEKAERVE